MTSNEKGEEDKLLLDAFFQKDGELNSKASLYNAIMEQETE